MVKKILSLLGVVSILSTMVVATAFAAAPVFISGPTVPATYTPVTDTGTAALPITYSVDTDSSVTFTVKDMNSVVVFSTTQDYKAADGLKTYSGWTGNYGGASNTELNKIKGVLSTDFVLPGNYTVIVDAKNAVGETTSKTSTVAVSYNASLDPSITDVVAPSTVDFGNDSLVIDFHVENPSDLLADIYYSSGQSFYEDDYSNDSTVSGDLSLSWDGKYYTKCSAPTGTYTAVITSRNAYGISQIVKTVDTASTYAADTVCHSGSSKITDIEFDPSATTSTPWDPIVDGKLSISWNINADNINEFTIQAIKGGTEFELPNDYSTDEGSDNLSPKWDGLDEDGNYVDPGLWKIVFLVTDEDDGVWYVERPIKVQYEKPEIDDAFVSKTEIDPELGEGVYFGFSLKDDANVDVGVIKGTSSPCGSGSYKVELIQDQEVSADEWYAVYWDGLDEDGDSFDYDDTFSIKLTAKSLGDDSSDSSSCKILKVDLKEDSISSTKSNVIDDVVVPPVAKTPGEVAVNFHLDAPAELSAGIWDGTSTGGSADYELLAPTQKSAGDYSFTWNLKDENGNSVRKGYYMYKVTAKKTGSSSIETETGKFYVGTVGEVFGEPGEKEEPSVVTPTEESCGFVDVSATNPNCAAIKWSKDNGVVLGNSDGTFKAYSPINRAEVLATILRAFDLGLFADDGTNLGFDDVTVGAWYMPYLKTGYIYGLISGDAGKKTVRPADSVSRVEFLKFVYEAFAKVRGVDTAFCSSNPYSDVPLGAWYTNYSCQAKNDNLFDVSFGMFMPGKSATRGEVAEALYRLLK